jgi:hypothetical protein
VIKTIRCNEWDCVNNIGGECTVTSDECPAIQEFFKNRRKNQNEVVDNDKT